MVENERHREKEITLEFSDWTTRGGKPAPVETVFLEPKTFTLPPCGQQDVTLAVKISRTEEAGTADDAADEKKDTAQRKQIPDVDDCLVVTADLRLVGCDHRPLRIALAIVPRDCDSYRVHCGCTCC
ncbi:MAG: hypothetical protein R3293_20860 [Candidatus Promineifilaceae bacterium]|nr:hypothetical protein [Candidatus Promineifilaceae bacterium]